MSAAILSLGTALPSFAYEQESLCHSMGAAIPLDSKGKAWLSKVAQQSAIGTRYSVLSDLVAQFSKGVFLGEGTPGMGKRNACYAVEAPNLAQQACESALKEWHGDRQDITHIISVSCTGMMTPGIEALLVDRLQLKRSTERFGINMMGCFGAFKGLALAQAIAKENVNHRILVVCTELCSLHFLPSEQREKLLGNILFADGAAAAIVGNEKDGLWRIERRGSYLLEDSQKDMTWDAGDHAYEMYMSRNVPIHIKNSVQGFAKEMLGENATFETCEWAIHPGGKAILESIEKACALDKRQTASSWEVLARYGNMSSPTFLFVLDDLQKQGALKEWTLGLGFGPGLSIEGILLRRPY